MSTLAVAERPRLGQLAVSLKRGPELLAVVGQLALALLVMHEFRLESRTFFRVTLLAGIAAIPHALLPLAWRLPAFVAISVAGLALAVGVTDAAWIVAVAGTLVALCHLPIRAWWRIALLVAAGGALAAARVGAVGVPWSGLAWAALGSMMMFRLALYFHAVRHEPERPTLAQAAAYFLMIPNPVFPLFPVVDFTVFRRSHYARDAVETYQTGMLWIARGLVHLLLYRVVYQHLPADPLALSGLGELTWYVLGTFLLYLRVSGQFHLIVGMLRLYGFDLPETHKLFYLSSSFTDFWRRINIYWKDFMMKLVYYPSFFRLRRFGGTFALIASTAIVFFVTWVLHGYQWFWLLGSWPISIPDVLFWSILGVLVIVTSLREAKQGRDRRLGASRWNARLAGRVVATFCALCVLWSLWSAESVVEWVWMWRAAAQVDVAGVALLGALLAVGLVAGGRNWSAPKLQAGAERPLWQRPDVRTAAVLLGLLAFSRPEVVGRLGPATPLVASMRETTLNARDAAVERRGYYEKLDHAPRLGAQGWETRAQRPAGWVPIGASGALRDRGDFLRYDLVPSHSVERFGEIMHTNAWGLHDVERTREKPAGTVRLAVMGPSFVMASGVHDTATFTALLERRLNAGQAPDAGRYEVLNFGISGYSLLQQVALYEERAAQFAPDVVFITTYASMPQATADHLIAVLQSGTRIPYPALDSLLRRWHVSTRLPWSELVGVLRIAATDVHRWALGRVAEDCRRRGCRPVLLLLTTVGSRANLDTRTTQAARDLGYTVIDLDDVYGPPEGFESMQLTSWDTHPNTKGNAVIAERLLAEIRRRPQLFPTPVPARNAAAPTPPTASPSNP